MNIMPQSFSKVVCKYLCKPNRAKHFQQIYKSFGNADFLHTRDFILHVDEGQSPIKCNVPDTTHLHLVVPTKRQRAYRASKMKL